MIKPILGTICALIALTLGIDALKIRKRNCYSSPLPLPSGEGRGEGVLVYALFT